MKHFFQLGFIVFFTSCALVTTHEMTSDKYWENITKSNSLNGNFFSNIVKTCPIISNQIESDSSDKNLVKLWGESFNFDSGAKKIILDEKIIEDIQAKFEIKNDNKIVNAGIMHSYGYLFSILETPYGFKRKRWIEPTISFGFNLSKNSISYKPLEGTLLSNLTYFAGRLAFKNAQNLLLLDKLTNVADEIKNFNYKNLEVVTLVEQITNLKSYNLSLKTTLVKLLKKTSNEENDYLLIYSTLDNSSKVEKLITAFPIKKDAYFKIIDAGMLGSDRPITIKYNGYIGSDKDVRFSGNRLILEK